MSDHQRVRYKYQTFRVMLHASLTIVAGAMAVASWNGYDIPVWQPLVLTALTNALVGYSKSYLIYSEEP